MTDILKFKYNAKTREIEPDIMGWLGKEAQSLSPKNIIMQRKKPKELDWIRPSILLNGEIVIFTNGRLV